MMNRFLAFGDSGNDIIRAVRASSYEGAVSEWLTEELSDMDAGDEFYREIVTVIPTEEHEGARFIVEYTGDEAGESTDEFTLQKLGGAIDTGPFPAGILDTLWYAVLNAKGNPS